MYRIIIIDDEEEIRKGIALFVNNSQPDYEIVGLFEDGKEAIEYLENNIADVIITDIKMSDVSGLEVLKYAEKNFPKIKKIVISGYRDFEYSSVAIECKASAYITKPTRYKELKDVFFRITTELNSQKEEKSLQKNYEQKEKEKNIFFRNEFLEEVFLKQISQDKFEKKIAIIDENFELQDSRFVVLSVGVADYEKYYVRKWRLGEHQFYSDVINNIVDFFQKLNTSCICPYYKRGIFKFIIYSSYYDDVSKLADIIFKHLALLKKQMYKLVEIEINSHISKAYENIINFFYANEINVSTLEDEPITSVTNIILLAKEYSVANIASDISLQKVADYVHMNSGYFSRFFKSQVGENFSVFIANLRINMAKQLLKEGKEKLSDIATKVGYSNASYFSKAFKENTGMTPIDYGRKVREEDEHK